MNCDLEAQSGSRLAKYVKVEPTNSTTGLARKQTALGRRACKSALYVLFCVALMICTIAAAFTVSYQRYAQIGQDFRSGKWLTSAAKELSWKPHSGTTKLHFEIAVIERPSRKLLQDFVRTMKNRTTPDKVTLNSNSRALAVHSDIEHFVKNKKTYEDYFSVKESNMASGNGHQYLRINMHSKLG